MNSACRQIIRLFSPAPLSPWFFPGPALSMAFLVKEHFLTDLKKGSPDIIVLGSNIPEELILAARTAQYWILGGAGVH